ATSSSPVKRRVGSWRRSTKRTSRVRRRSGFRPGARGVRSTAWATHWRAGWRRFFERLSAGERDDQDWYLGTGDRSQSGRARQNGPHSAAVASEDEQVVAATGFLAQSDLRSSFEQKHALALPRQQRHLPYVELADHGGQRAGAAAQQIPSFERDRRADVRERADVRDRQLRAGAGRELPGEWESVAGFGRKVHSHEKPQRPHGPRIYHPFS